MSKKVSNVKLLEYLYEKHKNEIIIMYFRTNNKYKSCMNILRKSKQDKSLSYWVRKHLSISYSLFIH